MADRRGRQRLASRRLIAVLLCPAVVFVVAFFLYPTYEIVRRAFTDVPPGAGFGANFEWLVTSSASLTVLGRTFTTALLVTLVCLVVGYPFAYVLSRVGFRARYALLGVVVLAFCTSFMVRNYAWYVLLQDTGPLNDLLGVVGLGPVSLLGTTAGVVIGMSQIMLPFMVLPVFAAIRDIDPQLTRAARSLGAPGRLAFVRVYLPLSLPGVFAGALLVFVVSLGFFITPTLLGSPTKALASQLIVTQIGNLLDWGRAGAISIALLAATFLLLGLFWLVARRLVATHSLEGVTRGVDQEDGRLGWGLRALAGGVVVWLIAPLLVTIPASLSSIPSLTFPPPGLSTQWYESLVTDPAWYGALGRSLEVGGIVVILSLVLGTPVAWCLSRYRPRGGGAVMALMLAPAVVPIVVFGVGTYAVFLEWGLAGTTFGLALAHTVLALPFVVVTLVASFSTFDRRLEWAAVSLGSARHVVATRVVAPLIAPGALTAAAFAFLTSFDEIVVAFFVVDPNGRTLPVEMYSGVTRQIDPTVAAAAVALFVLTTMVLICSYFVVRTRRHRHGGEIHAKA